MPIIYNWQFYKICIYFNNLSENRYGLLVIFHCQIKGRFNDDRSHFLCQVANLKRLLVHKIMPQFLQYGDKKNNTSKDSHRRDVFSLWQNATNFFSQSFFWKDIRRKEILNSCKSTNKNFNIFIWINIKHTNYTY